MKSIKIWSDSPSVKQLDEICSMLEHGEIGIFPTDTLYGICCDALNAKAVDRICKLKGINPEKAHLSIVCDGITMASEYSKISDKAFRMIKELTPGPFTFLLKSVSSLPKVFKGRKIVGIRIPDNHTIRLVAERLGHPLLTTSIEFEEEDYAVNPELICENYEGKVDFMIEGEEGDTTPSTIVDFTQDEPEIVREGKGEL
ncbi:MAG: threonylcarbamoyl-AMP synthase [Muribaculaceae bacterium]|nr:threonylcarbamoyl-AMP synthase [Muribaculaceae bacterium]